MRLLRNKEQSACDDDILQFGSPPGVGWGEGEGGLRGGGGRGVGFQGQVQGRLVSSAL